MPRRITIQREADGRYYVYDFDGVEVLEIFDSEKDAIAFAQKKKEELNNTDE